MTDEQLSNEIWKPIPTYEGRYEVSNMGRFKSLVAKSNQKSIRLGRLDSNGYYRESLTRRGTRERVSHGVSRLVLMAFVGLPKDNMDASHLNGNSKDNRLSNLIWESRADNIARKYEHGTVLYGEDVKGSIFKNNEIRNIRRLYKEGVMQKEIRKIYGCSKQVISDICQFKTWKHVV